MSRGGLKISKQNYEYETIVDQYRSRNASSLLQQIVSVMNNKPVYSSVEDAVKDMTERTGLNVYLNQIKSADKNVNKTASDIHSSGSHISLDGGETFVTVDSLNKEEVSKNINEAFNKSDSDLHDEAMDMIGTGSIENADDELAWLKNYCELYEKRHGRPYTLGMTSANKFKNLGIYDGIEDLENHGSGSDILASILAHKVKIPLSEYIDYAHGYIKGSKMSEKDADHELSRIDYYLNKHNISKKANIELPQSLSQYSVAEDIANFVKNNIKNTHGLGVTVPSLQHDILSLFGKYGVDGKDVMNDEVAKYLSHCILEAQTHVRQTDISHQLGLGVGKENEDGQQDVWQTLMPASS